MLRLLCYASALLSIALTQPVMAQSEDETPLPTSLDAIDALAQKALEANQLDNSVEAEEKAQISAAVEQEEEIRSPIQGWGTSIMFSLSERRKLQDMLDALERRRRLLAQQQTQDNQDEVAEEGDFFGDLIDQITGEAEKLQEELNEGQEVDTASLPSDTTVTDDGTTVIGDVVDAIPDPADAAAPVDQRGMQTYETPRGPIRAPNMFLNSILYKSDDEWLIWINDQQVTSKDGLGAARIEDVEIVRITPTKLILLWNTDDLDRIMPEKEDDWQKHRQIIINESDGWVKMILYPNQAFLGRHIELTEGRPSIIPEPASKRKRTIRRSPPRSAAAGAPSSAAGSTATKQSAGSAAQEKTAPPSSEREIMNQAIRLYEGLQNHGKSNE